MRDCGGDYSELWYAMCSTETDLRYSGVVSPCRLVRYNRRVNRTNVKFGIVLAIVTVVVIVVLVLRGRETEVEPLDLAAAWAAFEAGRPEEARALAVQAAEIGVTRQEDLGPLMELLIRTGEAPRAVAVYQAFAGAPGPVAGDSYILALLAVGRPNDAETEILRRFKVKTMTARTQQMRGRLAMARGKADLARRALLEAQRQDDSDPETWALLGRVFLVLREVPRAEGLLQEALRKFPDSLQVRKALSEVIAVKQELDDTAYLLLVDLLTPVTERRPQDLAARRDLGIALRRLGRAKVAENVFEALTQEQHATADDWLNLGTACAEQEHWEEAISAFQRSAAMESGREEVFLNLGNAYLGQAETAMDPLPSIARAREAYERALVLNPKSAFAKVGLGRAAVKVNPADDPQALGAIKFLEEAIALDPQCFEAHLQLALLYYDVWMPAEKVRGDGYWRAKREFEAAAALRPMETWTVNAREAYEELRK